MKVSKKLRKRKKKAETTNENQCEPSVDNVNNQDELGSSSREEPTDVTMMEKETLTNEEFDTKADESIRDTIKVDEPGLDPANLTSNKAEVADRNNIDNYGHHTDDSSDEQPTMGDEVDFKVSTLVSALASNSIIQKLCWLLKFYKTNSIATNHYIITVLRRICDDLELSPMLYQLPLLTIFYDILEEQKLRPCKEYENIVNFLTSLIRRMLRKMKSYPLLLVEVLFQKTRKECHYINCGSMLNELNGLKGQVGEGRTSTKNGGNGFLEDEKWVRRSLADALGDDDYVTSGHDNQAEDDPLKANFQMFRQIPEDKTGSSVMNNTIEESATSDREGAKEDTDGLSRKGNGRMLSDEMSEKLKDLYEKYKDNPDCRKLIAAELDIDGNMPKPQLSKLFRQLGVPAKAKKQSSDASSLNPGEKSPPLRRTQ